MDRSLTQQAYDYIRDRILNGEFPPDMRLATPKLCEETGFSSTPIREALARIVAEGMAERQDGIGVIVAAGSFASLDQLYDVRVALEGVAAAEAAKHATELQIEYLDGFVDQAVGIAKRIRHSKSGHATEGQIKRWLGIEKLFHDLIAIAARNPFLIRAIRECHAAGKVFDSVQSEPAILTTSVAEGTCQSNDMLMNAIRDRDPDAARDAMVEHIEMGRRVVASYLFGQSSDS